MMGDIVNLKRLRKRKARTLEEQNAEVNRAKFGRSKEEKLKTAAAAEAMVRKLDGHKRED
jgi:hypothetical protein